MEQRQRPYGSNDAIKPNDAPALKCATVAGRCLIDISLHHTFTSLIYIVLLCLHVIAGLCAAALHHVSNRMVVVDAAPSLSLVRPFVLRRLVRLISIGFFFLFVDLKLYLFCVISNEFVFSLALDRVPNFNDETMVFLKKSSLNQFLIFFFNRFASNVLKLVLIYANVVHYCQNFKHTIIIIKKNFFNKPTHQCRCVFS